MTVNNHRIMAAIFFHQHCTTLIVLMIYAICTLFYKLVLHVSFDSVHTATDNHYLDMELLKNDLLQSLWYMHMQPPLMNFIVGIALKIGGEHYGALMAFFYFIVGMVALVFLDRALCLLNIRPALRVLICMWLCVHPAFIIYANWVYPTHLEFSLCCIVLYYVVRLSQNKQLNFKNGFAVFFPCAILDFLRPQWHLVLFLGMIMVILLLRWQSSGKGGFLQGCMVGLFPVVLLYFKNFLLFGFFGASSWAGMDLAEVTAVIIPEDELQMLRDSGVISPTFPAWFDISRAERARELWLQEGHMIVEGQHPALTNELKTSDVSNFNYLPVIEGSKQDLKDSWAIICYKPMTYIANVWDRMKMTAQVPSLFGMFGPSSMEDYQRTFAPYKDWLSKGGVLFYVGVPLLAVLLCFWPEGYLVQHRQVILIGIFMAAYIAISSNAFSYGKESDRMRWGMEPFYLAFFAMLLEGAMQMISRVMPCGRSLP